MTARLVKEMRDLAPVLVGTALLMAVLYGICGDRLGPMGLFVFALGCGLMAASSFGNEFRHRTLPLLLSQPIPRRVIWREKMLALGGGLAAVVAVFWACQAMFDKPNVELVSLVAIPLCAFCGAPCLTLASRSGLVGLVSAAAVPGLVMAGGIAVSHLVFSGEVAEDRAAFFVIALMIAYCAVFHWLGYVTFRELQVVDGGSLELRLPEGLESRLARPLSGIWVGMSGPFASLVRKELRLQQASFLIAGLFCLVAIVGACAYWVRRDFAVGLLGGDGAFYVLIIPFIIGAIAVGEEREWGVSEWHLSLPPSAVKQWSAKMMVGLATSLILGFALPLALYMAGKGILGARGAEAAVPPLHVVGIFVAANLLMTSLAAYAATFTGSTLRAVLWAFGMVVAGGVLSALAATEASNLIRQWAGPITGQDPAAARPLLEWSLPVVGLLLLCGLVQWLACHNFRQSVLPARKLVGQLVAIFCCIGVLSLAASAVVTLVLLRLL